jgi:hypothetical protein
VGPALAHGLLLEFGSVERVVTADAEQVMRVRGSGRREVDVGPGAAFLNQGCDRDSPRSKDVKNSSPPQSFSSAPSSRRLDGIMQLKTSSSSIRGDDGGR